jgi:MYXO-CTERM domain-containing protein
MLDGMKPNLVSVITCALMAPAALAAAESVSPPDVMDVDLLIVTPRTSTVAEERAALIARYPSLVQTLAGAFGGDLPSLHVAFVTSDMGSGPDGACGPGDGGAFQNGAAVNCLGPDGAFVRDERESAWSERVQNYEGDLADVLACITPQSSPGCGVTQPLAAIEAALDGSIPGNADFLRPDAVLAVLILADLDDCSASDPAVFDLSNAELGPDVLFRCTEYGVTCEQPITRGEASYTGCAPSTSSSYIQDPQRYVDFLKTRKADPRRVVVGVLTGPASPVDVGLNSEGAPALEPTCEGGGRWALPSVRLSWLASQFTERSASASLCDDKQVDGALDLFVSRIYDAAYGLGTPPGDDDDDDDDDDNNPADPDGGVDGGGPTDVGCGCRSGSAGGAAGTALLLALAAASIRPARRRRSR